MDIEFRFIENSDYNFVKNSYMKSYRNSNISRFVVPELYNSNQSRLFDALLADSNVLIACNPANQYQILGYAVYNSAKKLIHYVYVKNPFRKNGIATKLLEKIVTEEGFDLSHLTPFMKSILFGNKGYNGKQAEKSKSFIQFNLRYNPYILFRYSLGVG